MSDEILLVKMHDSLEKLKSEDGILSSLHYKIATGGNWKTQSDKSLNLKYIVGFNHSELVAAYEITHVFELLKAPDENEIGRSRFDGNKVSNEIFSKLKENENMLVEKFGSGQSIAYASLIELNLI